MSFRNGSTRWHMSMDADCQVSQRCEGDGTQPSYPPRCSFMFLNPVAATVPPAVTGAGIIDRAEPVQNANLL